MSDIQALDIVECIDDRPHLAESRVMPAAGQLYTVSRLRSVGDGHSVQLKELVPTCYLGGSCRCGGCGWDAGRFRRVYRPNDALLATLIEPVLEAAE